MTVATVLTALNAHSGLNAIVSNRIYRTRLPKNTTYPAILFRASQEVENHLTGESALKHYTWEFECYGPSYTQLESLVTQLKDALTTDSGFKSVVTGVADDDYQDELENFSIFLDVSVWI